MSAALAVATLTRRELVRFFRQPNRVAGAVGSPLVFWLLLGAGVGRSFRPEGFTGNIDYLEYAYPGTLVMILLFTAIFSTISIIEDRKAGFLQSVLVAPVSRSAVVLGKMCGAALLALLQAMLFLALAPVAGFPFAPVAWLGVIGVLAVVGLALTGLGFVIAWRMDSIQGFHAIMNFVLLPLWLLSGSLFPVDGAAGWMQWIIRLNPLTYGLAAVRRLLYDGGTLPVELPGMALSLGVTALFTLVMFVAAARVARGHTKADIL